VDVVPGPPGLSGIGFRQNWSPRTVVPQNRDDRQPTAARSFQIEAADTEIPQILLTVSCRLGESLFGRIKFFAPNPETLQSPIPLYGV
jgi:hypothetical protein